jgi:hypothetical protein
MTRLKPCLRTACDIFRVIKNDQLQALSSGPVLAFFKAMKATSSTPCLRTACAVFRISKQPAPSFILGPLGVLYSPEKDSLQALSSDRLSSL